MQGESRFFAAANHDLRQPIHALQLLIAALRTTKDEARRDDIIGDMEFTLSTLSGFLDTLLDLSKLEAGTLVPKPTDFPLYDLMCRVVDAARRQAGERRIDLRVVPSRNLVCSDSLFLERILKHLLANALRAAPGGRVLVGCRLRGDTIRLEVWDDGAGIAEPDIDRIFEAFTQLDTKGRGQGQGLGLGLAITRRCADLLGHRVKVESHPGRGTMFAVELPCGSQETHRQAGLRTQRTVAGPIDEARLLLIGEDAESTLAVETLLQTWGAVVARTSAAEEAVLPASICGQVPAALVLLVESAGISAYEDQVAKARSFYEQKIPAVVLGHAPACTLPGPSPDAGIHVMKGSVEPAKLRALLSHLFRAAKEPQAG
jgi:anti-sigma regulatory factor (Ser/Thr protein kinase)